MDKKALIKDRFEIKCLNWLNQILILINIILIIIAINSYTVFYTNLLIATYIFIFTIYSISCFNSELYRYLKNKNDSYSIEDFIKKMYLSAPKLTLYSESYHYKDKNRKKKEKIITEAKNYNFNYWCFKDISENFIIDYDDKKKYFIKLELNLVIEFFDDISKFDYYQRRKNIIKAKKNIDINYSLKENWDIEGFEKYCLLNLGKNQLKFFNLPGFYFFCVFFPLIEFYKIYMESYCIEKKYEIRKLISTRNYLDFNENHKIYKNFGVSNMNMKIKINRNTINLNDEEIFNIYNKRFYNHPTNEEIKQSKLFVGENDEGWKKYLKDKNEFENEDEEQEKEKEEDKEKMRDKEGRKGTATEYSKFKIEV
jgi:hypothetical protein